jgi:hypothetical protein
LAEHGHFEKIDNMLNAQLIATSLGFDPSVHDMQVREQPAEDLHAAYQLVGKAYTTNGKKTGRRIKRTVNALNMNRIINELPGRYVPLQELNLAVELFVDGIK